MPCNSSPSMKGIKTSGTSWSFSSSSRTRAMKPSHVYNANASPASIEGARSPSGPLARGSREARISAASARRSVPDDREPATRAISISGSENGPAPMNSLNADRKWQAPTASAEERTMLRSVGSKVALAHSSAMARCLSFSARRSASRAARCFAFSPSTNWIVDGACVSTRALEERRRPSASQPSSSTPLVLLLVSTVKGLPYTTHSAVTMLARARTRRGSMETWGRGWATVSDCGQRVLDGG
eukprot:scaffold40015_cov29-Tisochrysis_lutea.AAC.2